MLLLASKSPRRAELIRRTAIDFYQWAPDYIEKIQPSLDAKEAVKALSMYKMQQVLQHKKAREFQYILTADTVIEIDNKILGKPEKRSDAKNMLKALSGRQHRVISAICIYDKNNNTKTCDSDSTIVEFINLSEEEIEAYLNTEEWKDAAGAYKIQGQAELLIKSIKGSYSCVMGLPLACFYGILRSIKFPIRKIFRPLDE